MGREMVGTVIGTEGRYVVVECPAAPAHLRRLLLVRGQMAGAEVGAQVRLAYQTTPTSGLWNVVAIEERHP